MDGYDCDAHARELEIDPVFDPESVVDPADFLPRVIRDGSFSSSAAGARSASRDFDSPASLVDSRGLRPARGIAP